MNKFIIILLLSLSLASCAPPMTDGSGVILSNIGVYVGGGIYRTIDRDAGVVCWVFHDGISCLPIHETKLGGSQ